MLPEFSAKRKRLLDWAQRGLDAVEPRRCTAGEVVRLDVGECALLAVGKAAFAMSRGAIDVLGERATSSLMIVPGNIREQGPAGFNIVPGDHPVPGDNSLSAGERLTRWLAELQPDMPLVVLLSGGGSALVEVPVPGMSLEYLQQLNSWLLGSGFDIHTINTVRARFSQLKRGGLLRMAGNRPVFGLVISDVPGDCMEDIASGPLSPVDVEFPCVSLPHWLQALHEQLPLPSCEKTAARADMRIVASNSDARNAIVAAARDHGIAVRVNEELRGDAAEQGHAIARKIADGEPGMRVFGGETSVMLPDNPGKGGRNQHLALTAAVELAGRNDVLLLALGSDGVDGNTNDAGALVDGGTIARIHDAGMDAGDCLRRADSNTALAAAGDIINTGFTGTNVSDLVIAWKF